jgi:hypothetical protein
MHGEMCRLRSDLTIATMASISLRRSCERIKYRQGIARALCLFGVTKQRPFRSSRLSPQHGLVQSACVYHRESRSSTARLRAAWTSSSAAVSRSGKSFARALSIRAAPAACQGYRTATTTSAAVRVPRENDKCDPLPMLRCTAKSTASLWIGEPNSVC